MAIDIEQKYKIIRPHIKEGDIIIFHGTSILSRLIQWCDRAKWNHVGVIIECRGALGICDANGNGVQWDRLSWRIRKYDNCGDFEIIRPLVSHEDVVFALKKLLKRSDDNWIKYDFLNGIKELINRRCGKHIFKIKLSNDRAICSSNDAQYAIDLGIVNEEFNKLRIQFPADYVRYLKTENARLLNRI